MQAFCWNLFYFLNVLAVLTSMLRRIMGIEKTLQEHSSMLTRVLDVLDVQEDAGPLLEEAVATVEELMELDEKLQNKDFAKKMVSWLKANTWYCLDITEKLLTRMWNDSTNRIEWHWKYNAWSNAWSKLVLFYC